MPNTPDNPFSQNFNPQALNQFMQNNPFGQQQQDSTDDKVQRRAKLLALQKISGNQASQDDDNSGE